MSNREDKEKEIPEQETAKAVDGADKTDEVLEVADADVVVESNAGGEQSPQLDSADAVAEESVDAQVVDSAEDTVDETVDVVVEAQDNLPAERESKGLDVLAELKPDVIVPEEDGIVVDSNVEVISHPDESSDRPMVEQLATNSKRKITSNKSISKKKKGLLAVAIAVVVVALVLSIVLPVVFYRAPRYFVKSGDGFTTGGSVGNMDKNFYVLSKNVSADNVTISGDDVYSIDFNKHTLSVSGEFKIDTEKEGTLYIGTRESQTEYSSKKALLEASSVVIQAPNLNVVLMADVSSENVVINAKSITLGKSISRSNMELSAQSVRFDGDIVGSTTSEISIFECPDVVVNDGVTIESTLNLVDSVLTVEKNATLDEVKLDDTSKATVSGTIQIQIVGGAQVTMEEGHTCQTYQDINTLVIFRDLQKSHVIKNCKNIIYVEKLAQPTDINIEEHNSEIYCNVAKVNFASGYIFMLNGEEVGRTYGEDNTKCNITDYVKDIGTYTVSVKPIGDFTSSADLTNQGHKTMYVDGAETSVLYNCVMTLQSPQDLNVNDDFELSFSAVPHADYYIITVDGVMVVRSNISSTSENLRKQLGTMGNHSIRVQAFSLNENIHDSAVSMISHSTTVQLETVEQLNASFSTDFTIINVSWNGVANGYDYVVYIRTNGEDASRLELGRTSDVGETGLISFTVKLEEIGIDFDPESDDYYEIIVVSAEHDYYTRSEEMTCDVRVQTDTLASK